MIPFRRNKWKKLYISIIAVIYLVFFTAQLSYKFHICANFPLLGPSDNGSVTKLISASDSKVPNFHLKFHPSVDKRYELEHIFALITPEFKLQHWYFEAGDIIFSHSPRHSVAIIGHNALRGPPTIA